MDRRDPTAAERTDQPAGADAGPAGGTDPDPGAGSTGRLIVAVLLYVGARLAVIAVVGGVLLLLGMPLLLAALLAIIVSLPVSLFAFRGLRARLNREVEAATATRRERRERLRAELRGDE